MFEFHYSYMLPKFAEATYADAVNRCIDDMTTIDTDYCTVLTDVDCSLNDVVDVDDVFKIVVVDSHRSIIRMFVVTIVGRKERTLESYN